MSDEDKNRIKKLYEYLSSKKNEAIKIIEECKEEAKQKKDFKFLYIKELEIKKLKMTISQKKIPKKYEKEYHELSKSICQDSMEKLRKAFLNIESIIEYDDFGNDFIDRIDDDLLHYLSTYMKTILKIEPYQYKLFLNTIKEIRYFKKSGFPTLSKDYIKRVESIKKKANELQKFSKEPIEIKIPILEHDSLYYLVYYLQKENVEKQNIRALFNYFDYEDDGKKNLPRSTNSFDRFFTIRTKLHDENDVITNKTYIYTPPYNYKG